MGSPSVPLSMLVTRDVPYEWHDGVALVAQLVEQVRSEQSQVSDPRIPDLRGLTLEETGRLAFQRDSELSQPAMPGAAQVLQQLLSGKDQPAPLRLFGMQAATAEATPTLEAFADELAKWERPKRIPKLAALYTRAFEQIGPAALTEEAKARDDRALNAKKQSVGGAAQSKAKPKKATAAKDSTASSRMTGVAIVLLLLALVAGGVAWYAMGRPSLEAVLQRLDPVPAETAPVASGDSAADPSRAAAGAEAAPRRRSPARSSPGVSSAEAELAAAREMFARQEYGPASVGFEHVLQILGTETSPQADELRKIAADLNEVALATVAREAAASNVEYRTGDTDVVEPVPLSYLPNKPDAATPPEKLQVLEVHITPTGDVDAAKFVMNRPSFRNSWWTSAAKAWRFTPATKDGKPVRFVMRIVMDDSANQR